MIIRILVEAFAGIVLMTLFSYIMSGLAKKNFKEPNLLNDLLNQANRDGSLAGWAVHYSIGVLFTAIYEAIWLLWDLAPEFWFTLTAGIISGIIGVIGWSLMLKLSNDPPKIALKDFYLQLVLAHVFFVLGVVITHRLFEA